MDYGGYISILTYFVALGAMSKSLATFATQPLIVAKVGLQSRPPASRNGKPFKSFGEVMAYIIEHEGTMSLFKGIGPQLLKGLLVQGLLMMTKERYVELTGPRRIKTDQNNSVELSFILLFRYVRKMRSEQLTKLATMAAEKAGRAGPILVK
jgi:hypothetical protein